MVRVTVRDDFFKINLSGIFNSVDEAKDFYAEELDTMAEEINVVKIEEV